MNAYEIAFAEIFGTDIGQTAPNSDRDELGFWFFALLYEIRLDGNIEGSHRGALVGGKELDILGNAASEFNAVHGKFSFVD